MATINISNGLIHSTGAYCLSAGSSDSYVMIHDNYVCVPTLCTGSTANFNNIVVSGDLTVHGSCTILNTTVCTTSAMSITNQGTGPALVVNQTGSQPVVSLLDDGNSVFYIEDGGNVGIGTTNPAYGLDIRNSTTSQTGTLYVHAALNSSGKGLVINSNTRTTADNAEHLLQIIDRANSDSLVTTVEGITLARLSTRLNTSSPLQVNSQIALGGSLYTFSTVQGGADLTLTSNANPANIGVNSNIVFKLGTSGGGGPNERMRIVSDGNVGIGITNPAHKLDVNGSSARIGGNFATTTLYIQACDTGAAPAATNRIIMQGYENRAQGIFYENTTYAPEEWFSGISYNNNNDTWQVGYDASAGCAEYKDKSILTVKNTGNVGIGTTSPNHELQVIGETHSTHFITGEDWTAKTGGLHIGNDGLTTGAVSFYNSVDAGASANIFRDSNIFYVGARAGQIDKGLAIDNIGYVGIGTTEPDYNLHVNGINSSDIYITSTAANSYARLSLENDAQRWNILVAGSQGDRLGFYDSNNTAYRMVIDTAGNVGIGTTDPTQKLYVSGNAVVDGNIHFEEAGDCITFYGNCDGHHGITSRNCNGAVSDDLRINTYGSLFINLDSNNNNDSDADFIIGRHGGAVSTMSVPFFCVNGETGDATAYGDLFSQDGRVLTLPVSETTSLSAVRDGTYKWGSSAPNDAPDNYGWAISLSDGGQPNQLVQTYGGATNKMRLFGRRRTNGTWDTSWTEYWSNANDGAGSGLDADLLDGANSSMSGGAGCIARYCTCNGYLYTCNWIYTGNTTGIFAGCNNAHFFPNTASNYGTWMINGNKDGWSGIYTCGGTFMVNSGCTIMGLYNDVNNEWIFKGTFNGTTELFYNGYSKLCTLSNGVKVSSSGEAVSLLGSTDGNRALFVIDGAANGDGSGGDYAYLAHNADGSFEIKNLQDNSINFATGSSGTTRMTITSAGNVGIGTTDPSQKLHVSGNSLVTGYTYINDTNRYFSAGGSGVRLQTAYGYIQFGPQNSSWAHIETDRGSFYFSSALTVNSGLVQSYNQDLILNASANSANNIIFKSVGTEYMRMTSAGCVGIGTTSPAAKLDVCGTGTVFSVNGTNGTLFSVEDDLSDSLMSVNDAAGLPVLEVFADSSVCAGRYSCSDFYIASGGNIGMGTSSPASLLHLQSSASTTLLRIDNTNAANDAAILLTDNNNPTGEGLKITYDSSVGDTYFNNICTTSTRAFTFAKGDFGSGTSLVTIYNNGNVGIGTASPNYKLHIYDTTIAQWALQNSERTAILTNNANDNLLSLSYDGNNRLQFNLTNQYFPFGNVGIGTTSPTAKLHVNGTVTTGNLTADYVTAMNGIASYGNVTATAFYGDGSNLSGISSLCGFTCTSSPLNTALGSNALASVTTASYNTAVGYDSLYYNTTGNTNTAVGYSSLFCNTSGRHNVAVGGNSLLSNTGGCNNVAVGNNSLYNNTLGSRNTASGYASLRSNTTGFFNTASGVYSLCSNTTGSNNFAFGYRSLTCNTTGSYNVAVGSCSLYKNTVSQNTAVGYQSLYNNTTGGCNTALGYQALYTNATGIWSVVIGACAAFATTGTQITAIGGRALEKNTTGFHHAAGGTYALFCNTTGSMSTAFGHSALYTNTTGSYNTAFGQSALRFNTTASQNTALGGSALYNTTTGGDNVAIGGGAGLNNSSGCRNIFIGLSSGSSVTTAIQTIAVGRSASPSNTNYHTVWGSSSNNVCNCVYTAWSNVSDCRDKTDIAPLNSCYGVSFIKKLSPVSYKWDNRETYVTEYQCTYGEKDGSLKSEKCHYGFIAQDIKSSIEELNITFDALGHDDSKDAYRLTYEELIAPLVKAVQELTERVEILENDNASLKDRIYELENK